MWPILHQLCGVILVIFGTITLPLPLPTGLIALTVGFALLAPYFPPIQRLVRYLRAKYPAVDEKLLSYRDRLPPIIKTTIDKTTPKPGTSKTDSPQE